MMSNRTRDMQWGMVWRRSLIAALLMTAFTGGVVGQEEAMTPELREQFEQSFRAGAVLTGGDIEAALEDVRVALDGGANPDDLAEILRRARDGGGSAEDVREILGLAARLAHQGLPIDPVMSSILLGLAKEVPLSRIQTVAEGIEEDLREARTILDSVYSQDEVSGTREERFTVIRLCTFTLRAGGSPEALRWALSLSIEEGGSLIDAQAAVLAMGCLLSAGIEEGRAIDVLESAWNFGFRGRALQELAPLLAALSRSGEDSPEKLFHDLVDGIRDGDEQVPVLSPDEQLFFLERLKSAIDRRDKIPMDSDLLLPAPGRPSAAHPPTDPDPIATEPQDPNSLVGPPQ